MLDAFNDTNLGIGEIDMDFVDWCSKVLNKIIEAESIAWDELYLWEDYISSDNLAKMLFGEEFIYDLAHRNKEQEECYASMFWAVRDLEQVGLVEMNLYEEKNIEISNSVEKSNLRNEIIYEDEEIGSVNEYPLSILPNDTVIEMDELSSSEYLPDHVKSFTCNVTEKGARLAKNLFPLWREICNIELDEDEKVLLKYVNQHSPKSTSNYYWLEGTIFTEYKDMDTPEDLPAMRALKRLGFVSPYFRNFYNEFFELRSTYKGLVWDTRRELISGSRYIDDLVNVWETTSVDFKRELHLETADQKAEFIKDILSLANTQASGRRWLIIGFNDKERTYFGPPDPKVTQNRIEQIIAQYVAPYVDIRYNVFKYRAGPIGMLQVIRDPIKLPYRIKTEMRRDDKRKSVQPGTIFVRHGSHVEEPTNEELKALQEEGDRARAN